MNANADSIEFASTRLVNAGSDDSEQAQYMSMMRMMSQQMGQASIDMDSVPIIYTATASLSVEWSLPTKDPNALALLPQGLKDQIEERDFAGSKNKPKLDEEALEKLESMQEMMDESYGYSMGDEGGAGPNIVFVGKMTQEERAEAMKAAITKARQSAELIAAAMETSLGKLKTVWPTETRSSSYAAYSPYSAADLFSESDEDSVEEVTAATADGLKLQVRVMAVYQFD
jgi:hypothetical protein